MGYFVVIWLLCPDLATKITTYAGHGVNKLDREVADMEVDMVADMEGDMVADM